MASLDGEPEWAHSCVSAGGGWRAKQSNRDESEVPDERQWSQTERTIGGPYLGDRPSSQVENGNYYYYSDEVMVVNPEARKQGGELWRENDSPQRSERCERRTECTWLRTSAYVRNILKLVVSGNRDRTQINGSWS